MRLVLDASARASWLMPDEDGADLGRALATAEEIAAPWLLWAEIRNILIVGQRRARLPQGVAAAEVDQVPLV